MKDAELSIAQLAANDSFLNVDVDVDGMEMKEVIV